MALTENDITWVEIKDRKIKVPSISGFFFVTIIIGSFTNDSVEYGETDLIVTDRVDLDAINISWSESTGLEIDIESSNSRKLDAISGAKFNGGGVITAIVDTAPDDTEISLLRTVITSRLSALHDGII